MSVGIRWALKATECFRKSTYKNIESDTIAERPSLNEKLKVFKPAPHDLRRPQSAISREPNINSATQSVSSGGCEFSSVYAIEVKLGDAVAVFGLHLLQIKETPIAGGRVTIECQRSKIPDILYKLSLRFSIEVTPVRIAPSEFSFPIIRRFPAVDGHRARRICRVSGSDVLILPDVNTFVDQRIRLDAQICV
jgi:hypothetical protein